MLNLNHIKIIELTCKLIVDWEVTEGGGSYYRGMFQIIGVLKSTKDDIMLLKPHEIHKLQDSVYCHPKS